MKFKMKNILFISACLVFSLISEANTRLVSIDGSITEIVYALGASDQLVAVDSTSVYPAETENLSNVGYMRNLSAEGILSVKPSLIITTDAAGPPEALAHLKNTGINLHLVHQDYSIEGIYQKVDAVAAVLGKEENAKELKASIAKALQPGLERIKKHADDQPRILVFLGMQGNQLMAAGSNTQADSVIDLLGGINAASNFNGYKPLNKEAVLASDADAIIVLQHSPQNNQPHHNEDLNNTFQQTKAAKNHKIIIAASDELLGFGPRFPQALDRVSQLLYAPVKEAL